MCRLVVSSNLTSTMKTLFKGDFPHVKNLMNHSPWVAQRTDALTSSITWPSNVEARTLSLEQHTLSNLCRDPCPVKRGLLAAVKRYVRKTHFSLRGQRTEMTIPGK